MEYGNDMRKKFLLHPSLVAINHGSYGAVPRIIQEERLRLISEQESRPDVWFHQTAQKYWLENLAAASNFVGAKPENCVFTQNVTTAINSVLKSLPFQPGDGIVIYSWTYGAVRNTCESVAKKTGAQVLSVDVQIPIKSKESVVEKFDCLLEQNKNVKLVILELITSPTATLLPLAALIDVCKRHGALVLVDGAHGPGQVPLNLEALGERGVDFFTGNFHKWVYAPRGCALLWIHPRHHDVIRPAITSANPTTTPLPLVFFYQGTHDNTPLMCCKKAIEFYQDIGGMDKIVAHNSALIEKAAAFLVSAWKTEEFPIPADMRAPCMRVVRLPLIRAHPVVSEPNVVFGDMKELRSVLANRFDICSVVIVLSGRPWVRLSAQVYNTMSDYERLAAAVLTLVSESEEDGDRPTDEKARG